MPESVTTLEFIAFGAALAAALVAVAALFAVFLRAKTD